MAQTKVTVHACDMCLMPDVVGICIDCEQMFCKAHSVEFKTERFFEWKPGWCISLLVCKDCFYVRKNKFYEVLDKLLKIMIKEKGAPEAKQLQAFLWGNDPFVDMTGEDGNMWV